MATIVEAVTRAINLGNDEHWAIDFNHMNNWQRNEFILHASANERSIIVDDMLIDRMTRNPGSAKIWASWTPSY